jgi:hypothetical protein
MQEISLSDGPFGVAYRQLNNIAFIYQPINMLGFTGKRFI